MHASRNVLEEGLRRRGDDLNFLSGLVACMQVYTTVQCTSKQKWLFKREHEEEEAEE